MYFARGLEMEQIDKLAVENGLEIQQMMELAGWQIIDLFKEENFSPSGKITIVVGKGNKGGDGLAAGRHLINRGYDVSIILAESELKSASQHHLSLLEKMDADILLYSQIQQMAEEKIANSDIVIDSLIGYHIEGAPRENYKELVQKVNESDSKIISYDIPTGLHPTTGEAPNPTISADTTLTLALPKRGLKENKQQAGKIYLGDIGIPHFIYNRIKRDSRPEFKNSGLLEIDLN